jgi:hypothetical protein
MRAFKRAGLNSTRSWSRLGFHLHLLSSVKPRVHQLTPMLVLIRPALNGVWLQLAPRLENVHSRFNPTFVLALKFVEQTNF